MSRLTAGPGIPTDPSWLQEPADDQAESIQLQFRGFDPPTSNTTYTPNQFFDVCLPHRSRGAVRLVAYMIRKTLGWCDAQGNPQNEQVLISYRELSERAGIGNTMIRAAIDEAMKANLIRCVRQGNPNAAGRPAISALYELRWVRGNEYVKDPSRFQGFFEGEGNRTDIPNQFFDRLVPAEPLSVVKVVGSIIRFSIGFADGRGRRRQNIALSYQHIQNYARIASRTILSSAIRQAINRGYIVRVEEGVFDKNAGRDSKAATYALRWVDTPLSVGNAPKSGPAKRSAKRTGNAPKTGPDKHSEKRTDLETKQLNETLQTQQQADAAPEVRSAFDQLRNAGFNPLVAAQLAARFPQERIENQIHWLKNRRPSRNPLGMLRRAIEEDWPEPIAELATSQASQGDGRGALFARHLYAGYAGYAGEPTAEPTAADTFAAGRYVRRLLDVWPDPTRVAGWGRDLGAFARERQSESAGVIVSAAYLLRAFGDRYLACHEAARERMLAEVRQAARAAHEAKFTPLWIDYLRGQEERIRAEQHEDFVAFERHREAEKERIRTSPWQLGREQVLARFDTEERRLSDFRQFFSHQVFDFWDWDQAHNRQGTEPASEDHFLPTNQTHL